MRARFLILPLLLVSTVNAAAQDPAPQPEPQPQPQPAPQPQPQPQPQPAPQPYPPPYYPQPYYPQPYPYQPPPAPGPYVEPSGDLEVIADFAALGILSSATLLDLRDYDDPGTGTLIVIGGALGGGALGWMIADRMELSRGEGHAVTAGMGLGLINAALLLVPLEQSETSEEVLGTLTIGGTLGAGFGLAVGKGLDLTSGQSMFATNVSLLGLGSALIAGALIDKDDGEVDTAEMTALVVGLDGGAAAGLLLAPKIKWSYGRARFVGAATLVGTFVGGMVGGLLATDKDQTTGETTTDPDITAGSLLVGMWGGFAGGIAVSRDWAPDPRYRNQPGGAPATTPPPSATPPVTAMPMVGDGRLGIVATGSF